MSSGRHRGSLGSLLLLLAGRSLGVLVEIHQDSINGTVGESVLLPVSYRFDGAPHFPVTIRWTFSNSSDAFITCTVLNCSLDAGGAPSSCSAQCFPTYRGRAELFPENGSLLLRDLQLSDSRVYSVTFREPPQTRSVTLTVQEQRPTPECPAGNAGQGNAGPHHNYVIGICSSVSLLLFLLICYIGYQGAVQQQKRKIIKQQQPSSAEESHMQSTVARDVGTIYVRIGDSFEQPQPRPTAEAVYTSITQDGTLAPTIS